MVSDRMQWWQEARFGMFIHWGVYSLPARGEWVMYQEHIPRQEYAPLADKFTARRYDPDAWVNLAKQSGMKYMVLTTRHHDGYSLFDSQVSDFTAPKTAPRRDLIQEYVEACHRGNMRVGFYYSLLDWRYPAYFRGPYADPDGWDQLVEYAHAQVRELCSNYGKIDVLWYDGGWPYTAEDWRSEELNSKVRQLQPEIIINNRSQLPEDFDTPEQHVRASGPGRPWEACMTLNDSWGYNAADDNWKPPSQVIKLLVRCAGGGGNLLLNVGPKPDGTIPGESARILRDVGRWMERNGGAIYGATRSTIGSSTGMSTLKGSTLYLHVVRWPGREIAFSRIASKVRSVHLMESGREVRFEQHDDRLLLRGLARYAPSPLDTVIVVELEGPPKTLDYFRDGWDWSVAIPVPQDATEARDEDAAAELASHRAEAASAAAAAAVLPPGADRVASLEEAQASTQEAAEEARTLEEEAGEWAPDEESLAGQEEAEEQDLGFAVELEVPSSTEAPPEDWQDLEIEEPAIDALDMAPAEVGEEGDEGAWGGLAEGEPCSVDEDLPPDDDACSLDVAEGDQEDSDEERAQ